MVFVNDTIIGKKNKIINEAKKYVSAEKYDINLINDLQSDDIKNKILSDLFDQLKLDKNNNTKINNFVEQLMVNKNDN